MIKLLLSAFIVLGLAACGGSGEIINRDQQGYYIDSSEFEILNTQINSQNTSDCSLFQSENSFFGYEIGGFNVFESGEVYGVSAVGGNIIEPTDEFNYVGLINKDMTFEPSERVQTLSDFPFFFELEVEFDTFDNTMLFKPKGFDIPFELGTENFPTFQQVSSYELEALSINLEQSCR